MDVHDIRYLHDDSLPEDDDLGGEFVLPKFITKKNLLSAGVIGILIISIVVVTLNISNRTTTQSSAHIGTVPSISPEPTGTQIVVKGEITCLSSKELSKDECNMAIKTTDGKTYSLQNVLYDDVSSGTLAPGASVSLRGTLSSSGSLTDKNNLYITKVDSNASLVSQPTQVPSSPSPIPSPTLTPTMIPTPTPIPHYIDSTPQPGVSYLTIEYIKNHGSELNGSHVNVGAYLVGGYIGEDACINLGICNQSQFFLSDTNNPNRDIADDMLMTGSAAEKEEDYTTGQNYYHEVIVVFTDSGTYLEKVY